MSRKIIRLFGAGGNFKTSIYKHPIFENYIRVPEFNREFNQMLSEFNKHSTTVHNIVGKFILLKTLLQVSLDVIMDRSLIDYAIMNNLTKMYVEGYDKAADDRLTIDYAMNLENQLFKNENCINVLLCTYDPEFLYKIIDEQDDDRGAFYDNRERYLECQEYYKLIIQNNIPDIKIININKVTDPVTQVNDLAKQIIQLW